jgi:hypothetical protein
MGNRTVAIRSLLVIASMTCLASPAWPCSMAAPVVAGADLIRGAEVIARVRAEGTSIVPGRPRRRSDDVIGTETQVEFAVIDVLKGQLASATIAFNGVLQDRDDRNDRPVPYDHVRLGGHAACFALGYRAGAEYLLFLRRTRNPQLAQPDDLTPYWSPLSPTNEQLFKGAQDPWLRWVTQALGGAIAPMFG